MKSRSVKTGAPRDVQRANSGRPIKRSFRIAGHQTSISLEAPFWDALRKAAATRQLPLTRLVAEIDSTRGSNNLSSAVRLWLWADLQARLAAAEGSA